MCLNPEEIESLDALIQALEAKKGPAAISKTTLIAMPTLVRIITNWDATQRLPVLDLLRLATAASPIPTTYEHSGDESQTLIDILATAGVFEKSQPNNAMLGTRAFVNIFDSSKAREYAGTHYQRIFQLASSAAEGTSNKNLKIAVATLALKYVIAFFTFTWQNANLFKLCHFVRLKTIRGPGEVVTPLFNHHFNK